MYTTTTTSYTVLPSKKDILERLYKAGNITFDEMWILMQDNSAAIIYNPGYTYTNPNPNPDPTPPWTIS